MVRSSVSVVIPIYNEIDVLPELTRRLESIIAKNPEFRWHIIYVDDGSSDGSSSVMENLSKRFSWLSIIFLTRNFGHQNATTAGIDHATGDAVIIMDGDLQDPPELIPEMLSKWKQGYDVVYATRKKRDGESKFKLYTARLFYRMLHQLSDTEIPVDTGDFRLMSRRAIDAINQMPEQNRFLRGMVSWIGFKQTAVHYERDRRFSGNTKFTLPKMLGFAVNGVLSFSTSPLHSIMMLGVLFTGLGFAGFIGLLIKLFMLNSASAGWVVAIIVIIFVSGIQLFCTGVIGEYISRIFDEVRRRPLYLIQNIKGQLTQKSENKLKEAYLARTGTANWEAGHVRFFEDLQRTRPR